MKIVPLDGTDRQEFENLHTPLGVVGSGRVRYAAAMHFFEQGLMSDRELEAYRVCAKDDNADPLLLLGSLK